MKKPVLNATEKVLLIRALRMKGDAQRATDLALSPMTGKGPKRCGIRIPERADDGEPARLNQSKSARLKPVLLSAWM